MQDFNKRDSTGTMTENEPVNIGAIRGQQDTESLVPEEPASTQPPFTETTAEGPADVRLAARQASDREGAGLLNGSAPNDVPDGRQSPAIHIRELTADPSNRREHNPRNVGLIVDALHRVGAGRSIVIDEHNVILAGNATIDAAAEAGIERVRIIEASGHEIIAVRRRGLTDEQKRHLALADNRAAELATWDLDQLRADAEAGLDLAAFFEPSELADLLGADAPVPDFPETAEAARLDQLTAVTCPECGHRFRREELP